MDAQTASGERPVTDREQRPGVGTVPPTISPTSSSAGVLYPIPAAALDDRLAWIGTSGSGKTYNAGGGVERLLKMGARVVIVDPLDVWWGLRLQADGEKPAFPLVIFGGAHGDMPLNENAGALLGETAATMSESCIVSLGGLQTKAAERRFMLAFLDAIYRKTNPAKCGPFHIVFDEADLWAPQRSTEPMLQSRMEEIIRRGRIKGFIPWLITQRPAVLSKDILSMADGLIAFKLMSSQDRDALGGWIEGQADRQTGKDILNSLPAMQRGQGVVWVPGRGILETATFPLKSTFDSSRTPERGEVRRDRALKPLDLSKLKDRLGALEEETKANDPKALKAEVVRLTRELAKAQRPTMAPTPEVAPARVANAEEVEAARNEGKRQGIAIGLARAQSALSVLTVDEAADQSVLFVRPKRQVAARVEAEPMPAVTPTAGVTGPGQRILDSLAWWAAFGIAQPSNEQVAFIAGYLPTSTGYTNPRSALKTAGLIDYPAPGVVRLTEGGAEKANAPAAAPSREEMHRRVRGKLSGPQQRILAPLIEAHPAALTNAEVCEKAGYSPTSTGYTNPRSSLRTLNLIDYPSTGQVRAADWLFP